MDEQIQKMEKKELVFNCCRSFLESWSGFPNARRRLLNTVLRSGAKNPVFLSGKEADCDT